VLTDQPRIAVVICSLGRPEIVRSLLPHLLAQTSPPREIVFAVTGPADLPADIDWAGFPVPVRVITSPKGLCVQRNRGLDAAVDENDIIVFFDDDFVPSRFALERIARAFALFPKVSGLTGRVLADGVCSGGIEAEAAARMVADWDADQTDPGADPKILASGLVGLYGCNMAFRTRAIGGLRFDERLPLYSWLEDVDFASRVPGEKVRSDALVGVHCGVKAGRERNGRLLGYSQIANPYYLFRKGSVPLGFALRLGLRNTVANHLRAARPEDWIDRRGRMRGNWAAITDILRGRSAPERVLNQVAPPQAG
jgi:glycosyltransferase involved in cell wall biosynthesis